MTWTFLQVRVPDLLDGEPVRRVAGAEPVEGGCACALTARSRLAWATSKGLCARASRSTASW